MAQANQYTYRKSLASVRFEADNVAIQQYMKDGGGPVVHMLIQRGDLVKDAAKQQIRMGHIYAGLQGQGGGARQNLSDTVHSRLDLSPTDGPIISVGSDLAPLAIIVHDGSKPHDIVPRTATVLRFMRPQGGVIFTKRVRHPGTKPNRYLLDNLHLAVQ